MHDEKIHPWPAFFVAEQGDQDERVAQHDHNEQRPQEGQLFGLMSGKEQPINHFRIISGGHNQVETSIKFMAFRCIRFAPGPVERSQEWRGRKRMRVVAKRSQSRGN